MSAQEISVCRVCRHDAVKIFTGSLLNNQVAYFECPTCGYIQTETPYWLERSYVQAMNDSDTGALVRNQTNVRIVLVTLLVLGKLDCRLVDYAGGYGTLVRLLRDRGVNAFWSDPYCKNLFAKGFEHTNAKADFVTAFEAFEHFAEPAEELDRLLAIAPNILFSTEIVPDPTPMQDDWWYYGKDHGQHIGFFRVRTLEKLAAAKGKFFTSDGTSYHLMTDRPMNRTLWKLMRRACRLVPWLGRRSLTMSDYEHLKGRQGVQRGEG